MSPGIYSIELETDRKSLHNFSNYYVCQFKTSLTVPSTHQTTCKHLQYAAPCIFNAHVMPGPNNISRNLVGNCGQILKYVHSGKRLTGMEVTAKKKRYY